MYPDVGKFLPHRLNCVARRVNTFKIGTFHNVLLKRKDYPGHTDVARTFLAQKQRSLCFDELYE